MKKFFPLFFFLCAASQVNASFNDWRIQRRGNLLARLTSYTDSSVPDYGQLSRVELEQTTTLTDQSSLLNQLRVKTNSIDTDLSTKSTPVKKDSYETVFGENYFKYKGDGVIAQIGYQEVVWGESFGFNYADIINPKDQRETLFADASYARLPLLLFNGKKLFSVGELNGSLQLLYSPEPRFSKTLPLELFIGSLLPQSHFTIIKDNTPSLFKKSELGGKVAASYQGLDTSLFYYSYLDRDPSYSLLAATPTNIALIENHSRINSTGLSLSKTVFDFVLRSDLVFTQKKPVNYLENNLLKSKNTNMTNFLISLDTPTYNNFAGILIFAESRLADRIPGSFREKTEQYSILKITKSFEGDKAFEVAYTHEFENTGHSIQTIFSLPLNNTTDLKIGGQTYWGTELSNLNKLKKIDSVFISLRNYFQI